MNLQSPWAPVVAAGIVALGAFLGNLASLVGVWYVQAKTLQREREAKEREAKEKRANRWDDLQMRTLMDLQDTLKQLANFPNRRRTEAENLEVRIQTQVKTPFTQGDIKSFNQRLDQLSDELATIRLHAMVLSVRVPDEQLAEFVKDVVNLATNLSDSCMTQQGRHVVFATPEAFMQSLDQLADAFGKANRKIGELLAALRPEHP